MSREGAGRGRTLVRVGLPDALRRLEGMEGVGEVHVWVRLVYQPVQHVHSLQHSHFLVGEAPELGVLGQERRGQHDQGPSCSIHLALGVGEAVPPSESLQRSQPGTFFLTKSTVCCECMSL